MNTSLLIGGLAIALTGCVAGAPTPPPASVASLPGISYETTPCRGFCPVYEVSILPDGRGVFRGIRHVAAMGEHPFTATPDQYRAFAARLAPYRPEAGPVRYDGPDRCDGYVTDMPGVAVTWAGRPGALFFDYGCGRGERRAMAEALRSAPDLLPIGDLVGAR